VIHYSDGGDPGGSLIGVCWATIPHPTIDDHSTEPIISRNQVNYIEISDLKESNTYYIRAFGQNRSGLSYGNQIILILPDTMPRVTTGDAIILTETSVSLSGIVEYGGKYVNNIYKGIVCDENPHPHYSWGYCDDTPYPGNLSCSLDNLKPNTIYYYYAWATLDDVVYVGEEKTFTTTGIIPW
jgi:hypothetical protein